MPSYAYRPLMDLTGSAALQGGVTILILLGHVYLFSAGLLISAWWCFFFLIKILTAQDVLLQILKSLPVYFYTTVITMWNQYMH